MKNRHRKHRETGGVNAAAEDAADKPQRYNQSPVEDEAEERKGGGRAKRRRGGPVHHEAGEPMKHAKHVGPVQGEGAKVHAGRKPRKSGGRTGADCNPFSSARHGTAPKGRNVEMEMD